MKSKSSSKVSYCQQFCTSLRIEYFIRIDAAKQHCHNYPLPVGSLFKKIFFIAYQTSRRKLKPDQALPQLYHITTLHSYKSNDQLLDAAMSVMPLQAPTNAALTRIASSMLAAKELEGNGQIIHDSYTKDAYTKRRHGFLGKHPDFETNSTLLPKVRHEANQVFDAQADELSVEQCRSRELFCQVEPLLPFPTTTNTETLDNFRSTGPKEWTAETGHPTHFTPSPQLSPRISATETTNENQIPPETNSNAMSALGMTVPSGHGASSVARTSRGYRETVTAGPDPEPPRQQTRANTAPNTTPKAPAPFGGAFVWDPSWPSSMDEPQPALNAPENAETMRHVVKNLGAERGSLTIEDAPKQYQQQRLQEPSSLMNRAQNTPVKSPTGGTKRPAPFDDEEGEGNALSKDPVTTQPSNIAAAHVDVEEAETGDDASDEAQNTTKPAKKRGQPAAKRPRVTVTAQEDPLPEKRIRRPTPAKEPRSAVRTAESRPVAKLKAGAATFAISEASSASDESSNTRISRPTQGGKSLPKQSGSSTPAVARRQSHPATVSGSRLPKSRAEAAEAAVERRQALMSELLSKKKKTRHPDLGPEFFDTANFTEDEKDIDGNPPVRCVCGDKVDDDSYTGAWIGCDNDDCRVWQHVTCMGEAVPAPHVRDTAKYLCQQCDPFAHRRLIQRLRKDHPLP